MTIFELEGLKDILQWAKGVCYTEGMHTQILTSQSVVNRELNLRLINPITGEKYRKNPYNDTK